MAIAIDRVLAGDINNPSFEVINWCVKEHQKEVPRLQMLFDYYEGIPHKMEDDKPSSAPQDRGEVFVNNAKYVTDMMVGFTVGAPISYTAPKNGDITLILQALNRMRIRKHDKELAKDISVYGIGLELHYLAIDPKTKAKTIPKIASIDPRGMFVVVDDTVDREKLFAVRYLRKRNLKDETYYEFNIYTKQGVITYISKDIELDANNLLDKPSFSAHYYNDVPVTEYRNNEEKQGDYEQQLSQIDAYNKLQTGRIKDKENFIKAVMVLYGFTLPEERPGEMNGNVVVEAPAREEGGGAEFLVNTFDEQAVQVLADSLLDDFHKTSYVPNLNDENFSGNVSGEAMKYKLFGLLLAISTKIGYMEDGLIERLQLLSNIISVKGPQIQVEDTKITFKPNLPINRKDIIEQIRDSQEFVPLLISLGWLDDIDDPEEALEMLNQQKMEELELSKRAFGQMNEHSHSDLEEVEECDTDTPAES